MEEAILLVPVESFVLVQPLHVGPVGSSHLVLERFITEDAAAGLVVLQLSFTARLVFLLYS